MHVQRIREAENRVEMQAAKWTTEGIVKGSRAVQVFYDAGQALIVGSMLVLL